MRSKTVRNLALFSLCLVLLFSGCIDRGANEDYEPWTIGEKVAEADMPQNDGVRLTMREGSLLRGGATFVLKNETEDTVTCGSKFYMQMKIDDAWYRLDDMSAWSLELYVFPPDSETTFPEKWDWVYRNLPNGTYRLIKEMTFETSKETFYAMCEFTLA